MKKSFALWGIALALLLVLASCTTVSFEGLQMQTDLEGYSVVREFEIELKDTKLLGAGTGYGLMSLNQPDERIFEEIRREIDKASGDAAVDVTIQYKTSLGDMIWNSLTGTLYSPRTIVVTGSIVKYN
jgi:hypothetical protein